MKEVAILVKYFVTVYTLYNRFWLLMPHCRTRPLFFNKKTVFSTERERERNDEI